MAALIAWAVGVALLFAGRAVIGDDDRTAAFLQTSLVWALVAIADFFVSFSYTLFPRRTAARDSLRPG